MRISWRSPAGGSYALPLSAEQVVMLPPENEVGLQSLFGLERNDQEESRRWASQFQMITHAQ